MANKDRRKSLNIGDLNPRVSIKLGITYNAGNHQFVKADFGLEVDVPGDMTVEEASSLLQEEVLDRLDDAIEAALELL
jgi:hypothetical protein